MVDFVKLFAGDAKRVKLFQHVVFGRSGSGAFRLAELEQQDVERQPSPDLQ